MDFIYYIYSMTEKLDQTLPSFISKQISLGKYNFINLQPDPEAHLAVVCVGLEETSEDYSMHRDSYGYHAIEYIVSGNWKLKTDAGEWDLRPGAIYCYGPKVSYSLKHDGKGEHRKYFLNFTGAEAKKRLLESGLSPEKPSQLVQVRWIQNLFEQLLDTSRMQHSVQKQISQTILSLMLDRVPHDLFSDKTERSQAKINYLRCRQFITQHYLEYGQITEVAQACGLSSVHLSRLFKKFDDETPKAYLGRLKMSHAAELILRKSLPIKSAAAEVGFSDPYHFSRVFKSYFGVSPRLFANPKN